MPTTSQLARFDTLFIELQRPVLAYAIRRTQTMADAEDVAAETFTIAWRRFDAIPADGATPVAVRRRPASPGQPSPWQRPAGAPRGTAAHRGRRDPIARRRGPRGPVFTALASLSTADQELLRLVAWQELGNQQIAAVLGITPNAVAIRLHRARSRFADALAREKPDDDLKHLDPSRTSADVKGTNGAAWKGVAK